MNFYGSIFPGFKVLNISRYGEGSPGPTGTVVTATFTLHGQESGRITFTFSHLRLKSSFERGRPLGDDPWTTKTAQKLGLQYTLNPRGRPAKNGSK